MCHCIGSDFMTFSILASLHYVIFRGDFVAAFCYFITISKRRMLMAYGKSTKKLSAYSGKSTKMTTKKKPKKGKKK